MQHIAGSARGKFAKTQQDLLKIAMSESSVQEEMMEHPICEVGFSVYGETGLERMDDLSFRRTVVTLMKSRPSSRLWDIVPDVPYKEDKILIQAPEAYRMTFEEKGEYLRNEFMRRPKMVGFRLELHNIERKTDQGQSGVPSVSFTIYEATDDLGESAIPVSIRTIYRTNF